MLVHQAEHGVAQCSAVCIQQQRAEFQCMGYSKFCSALLMHTIQHCANPCQNGFGLSESKRETACESVQSVRLVAIARFVSHVTELCKTGALLCIPRLHAAI